ncbi:MAG: hypothetical protein HZB15_10040 [Actinobacteria bacterium]|nr:hypothetical protein [Actinomycetota bacterium]
MLSWSSTSLGTPADITAIVDDARDAGLPWSAELVAFAQAIGGWDDGELERARNALVAAAGDAFMVDAAAVVANFEMMTRDADGTGARFHPATAAPRLEAAEQLGITGFTSAR